VRTREFDDFDWIEPSAPRPEHEIDFSIHGRTVWLKSGARVDFLIRHMGQRRLVVTELELSGIELSRRLLKDFPLDSLCEKVREWIVADGEPRTSDLAWDLPAHRFWASHRESFVSIVESPSSSNGPSRGRPIQRDDEYLMELAADYVRLGLTRPRDFRRALFEERQKGPNAKSEQGLADDIRLARAAGWLAESGGKGDRSGSKPGARLLTKWETDGYPRWWAKEGKGGR
jgi:hypothetical protein